MPYIEHVKSASLGKGSKQESSSSSRGRCSDSHCSVAADLVLILDQAVTAVRPLEKSVAI